MKRLKDWPLAFQIWMVFTSVILVVFILLALYFSVTIKSFFTNETYRTIKIAQENLIRKSNNKANPKDEVSLEASSNDIREVKHIRLSYSNNKENLIKIEKIIPDKDAAELFLKKLGSQVQKQSNTTKKYVEKVGSSRILYLLRVNVKNKKGNFIVSYMWDTYKNSLATNLLKRVFSVMIIALIISVLAAKYLAQRLVVPLKELQNRVRKIGKKQWHENINVDREDEIGELSRSIEEMRKELVKQDEYEQTMLQQSSHDLKTPLMVIRSYVKAVEDGIYPKGNLESTMKVIDFEAERMQKRIKNLLCLTKIKYMAKHEKEFNKIYIKDVLEGVTDNFMYNERSIKFELDINDIEIIGNEEQWTIVFENIIDNEMRYAKSLIRINIYEDDKQQYISIYNDGEKIPEDKLKNIFEAFSKDKGGNFGLGLDIVKRIITMYNGNIKAENEENGVSFIISLRKQIEKSTNNK